AGGLAAASVWQTEVGAERQDADAVLERHALPSPARLHDDGGEERAQELVALARIERLPDVRAGADLRQVRAPSGLRAQLGARNFDGLLARAQVVGVLGGLETRRAHPGEVCL